MVKFETSHYPCLSQWMSYYTLHENSCFSYSVYAGFFVPERVEIVTVRQLCHIDNNYWLPTIAFQNFFLQKSPGYMVEENLCMLHQVHIQSSLTKTDASWGIFLPINTFETVTIVFTCFMLKQGTQFICLHMSNLINSDSSHDFLWLWSHSLFENKNGTKVKTCQVIFQLEVIPSYSTIPL